MNEKIVENSNQVITSFGNKIKTFDEQFNTIEVYKNQIKTTEINLLDVGFKFDGTDESQLFQSLMPTTHTQRVVIKIPQGRQLKIKNISFTGYLHIKGNFSTIVNDTPEDFMFKIDPTTNVAVLFVDNLQLEKIGLIDNQMNGDVNGTRRLYIKNVWANSLNQRGVLINARSNDFVNLENIFTYGYDTNFKIISDFSVSPKDRMNTQIKLKNIGCGQCNYALNVQGVDKLSIDGLDISQCKTALLIGIYVRRANIKNFHCEYHGYYTSTNDYDGYGVYFFNRNLNSEITFENSSVLLPSTNAKAGISMKENTSFDRVNNSKVMFTNVFSDSSSTIANYKALKLNGFYIWNGDFNYGQNDVSLGWLGTGNTVHKGIIMPYGFNTSRNILSFDKITSLSNFSNSSDISSLTLTSNNKEVNISNTTSSKIDMFINFTASVGWHTLILNGNMKNVNNLISIGMNTSPYTTIYSSSCCYDDIETNRIYFYIPEERQYRISLRVMNGTNIDVGDIGLYKGFKNEF